MTYIYRTTNSFVFLLPIYFTSECRGRARMVVRITSTWQEMSIVTKVVNFLFSHKSMCFFQQYKTDLYITEILLKVTLNTHNYLVFAIM